SVGYRTLDDLKRDLRGGGDRPWMSTDRLDEYRRGAGTQPAEPDGNGSDGPLASSLERELDAIRHVYRLAESPVFAQVADRIAHADAVCILGIQSTRGISNAFSSYLEYLRPRVFYSDGQSGSYVDSLNSEF
ncbi:hypothetical protein NO135_20200, partial [Clostridioides difficile]|nr:hypothetical protein [Clostridioides difficile]